MPSNQGFGPTPEKKREKRTRKAGAARLSCPLFSLLFRGGAKTLIERIYVPFARGVMAGYNNRQYTPTFPRDWQEN